jgi:hypothetical protein
MLFELGPYPRLEGGLGIKDHILICLFYNHNRVKTAILGLYMEEALWAILLWFLG